MHGGHDRESPAGSAGRIAAFQEAIDVIATDDGSLIRLEADVLFDFDKHAIKPSAIPTLEKVSELIRLSGDRKVEVAGYADAIGRDDYNLSLSWKRSNAVIDWLVNEQGFPKTRFRPIGRGEEGAVAANQTVDGQDNPVGRELNRRVEILIRNQYQETPSQPRLD